MKVKTNLLVLVILFLFSNISFATTASFQGLGDLPGTIFQSGAEAVSADGSVVVGYSYSDPAMEAFRWTSSGGMVGLGRLTGSGYSYAVGVSPDGSVIVGSNLYSGFEAFRWEDLNGNGLVDPDEKLDYHPEFGLGDLPGGEFKSEAYGASDDCSVIVGESLSDLGREAFRWENGVMVGLGDLPGGYFQSIALGVSADGSVVVGESHTASGAEAFRWENGVMVGLGDLPGGNFGSCAYDVSASGSVIVGYGKSAFGREASRWENGVMVGLGDLPGGDFDSFAWCVSADGTVIVGNSNSALGDEAFIWDADNGMRSLQDLLVNDFGLDLTGWLLTDATGISANGLTIVGYGINPDGYYEGWIATIPEPASVLLLGLGGLISLRRRRN